MTTNLEYNFRLQQKLMNGSQKDPESECWVWLGQIANSGRGRITIRDSASQSNKVVSVETASYIAFLGDIPEGKLVKQSCGNRLCVKPDHLELFEI